jgi:hypothetical protein
MDISKSVLTQSVTIDFGRSLIDTTQCATFTELSCASNKKPYVIHTRKLFSACGSRITGIQTALAKDGDWAFNAAGKLECRSSVGVPFSSHLSPPITYPFLRFSLVIFSQGHGYYGLTQNLRVQTRNLDPDPGWQTRHLRRDQSMRGRVPGLLERQHRQGPLGRSMR